MIYAGSVILPTDEIIAFMVRNHHLIPVMQDIQGISLSAGRIADVHCKRDWSKGKRLTVFATFTRISL